MKKFKRTASTVSMVICVAGGIFMLWKGIPAILNLDFSNTPDWIRPFLVGFMGIWVGFAFFFTVGSAFLALPVGVSKDAVGVCLGSKMLWKIPAEEIHMVGRSYISGGNGTYSMDVLVMSRKKPEDVEEKGQKLLKKKRYVSQMASKGVTLGGPQAWLFQNNGCLLWIQDTQEARETLRNALPCAKFYW